ncbi:hypothetical protein ACQ4PT_001775 [Festuca glaucescens]
MDLKPTNILIDHQVVPKITDFGLSRLVENTQTMTVNRFLSLGYCAPEYLYGGRMSVKSDIYSLGVIIIELVTGHKSIPDQNNVLRRWRHRWKKSAKETPLGYQQVTKCIEIGLRCQENDPYRRPFIGDILHDIIEIEDISGQNSNTSGSTTAEISPYMEDDMLGIEPLQLHFPFELNKQISCSLQLTNMTDSYIAFSVQTASPLQYYTHPNKDIVPPRSKFTIDITLQPQKNAPRHADGFIVRSTKVNDGLVAEDITTEIFNREAGNVVDEVNLDVIFNAQLQAPHLSEEPNNFSLGLLAVLGTEDLKNREASNVSALFAHTGSEETVSKIIPAGFSELLDIHPPELRFTFEPNKLIPCSLHLTNSADWHVAFKLKEKSRLIDKRCFLSLPLYGIVPPRSTYTLVVTTDKRKNIPEERNVDFILQNSVGDKHLKSFRNLYDCDRYFEKVEELGNMVHNVTLKVVYTPQGETACEQSIPPSIKVTFVEKTHAALCSLDANQTEPWIITGHYDGCVCLWHYDMQKFLGMVTVTEKSGCLVKCIERLQWFLARSYYEGFIHVYNYKTEVQRIKSFSAHDRFLVSMSVHPTQPFVLSSSDTQIKLWDWDRDWECRQTFTEHLDTVKQVAFNPWDTNCFASVSRDLTVKVWSLDSSRSMYTLAGHSDEVNCLDFFVRDNQQYLITGSDDMTAKIWDLQGETCVHTLKGFMFPVVSVVSHHSLQLLITGTRNGAVHLWSLTNFRLERILNIGCHRDLHGLAALMGSSRIIIGDVTSVSMVEIHGEEPADRRGKLVVPMSDDHENSI